MRKSTDGKGQRMTPPSPSYMSNDQFAGYLADLRTNRTARPGGARPLPTSSARAFTDRNSFDAASQTVNIHGHRRAPSQAPSAGATSISTRNSTTTSRGRDYYPTGPTIPLKPSEVVPTATYMERGQRWMEKEEAVSLREAMQDMDIQKATRDETSEDDDGRLPHLRRNSYAHARTASIGTHGDEIAPSGLGRDVGSRSVSVSSTDSNDSSQVPRKPGETSQSASKNSKSYGTVSSGRRRTSLKRNISGEVERPFSGDQIWEEPEVSSSTSKTASAGRASPDKLPGKPRGPVNRARFEASRGASNISKALNQVEIHRNPPTQSRNAQYTTNTPSPRAMPEPSVERRSGVEVRGQDIRAATSRKLKDRSSRLPEPTAVSDSPGRPIVSFDANWEAPDEVADVKPDWPAQDSALFKDGNKQPMAIPRISVAEDQTPQPRTASRPGIPSIAVAGPDSGSQMSGNVPAIVLPDAQPAARPLPSPDGVGTQVRRAQRPRGHWSPAPGAVGRATATCHECGLPIEGRLVALAGFPERFHPHCFSCLVCGTSLEAMEISPEPDHVRAERLERIRRRAAGEQLVELPGTTEAEDGDERLRFYCHLDWHELFAPRCKHCRTPILGEHIVALGQHWHYGHFFCAECGDPFEHGMTHIEKDGYAWCINCQTKRTERRAPKCKNCKTAVIGQYIQALGGEWHEHCFRCAECQGGFDDGQIFPKEMQGGMVVLCTACRTRELKS
ncbi:LIM domain-containing protein [Hirsutella rhossiliensis]|uniref:LIM domain-containing protein n=1 Tax=Hirsutella rhossiliensis TaxID=111463 RepID=A0A9P8SCV7_9HYPO|nr:LIM domain-containing protein [Hirsutella rhossiliensis]KAH0957289.1 LIM domain-containing protein [Hirsutella rhossiliensis]